MNRFLLTFMLCVFLVDTTFGLDLSLAPGLSVKNAFLYLIMIVYMIETAIYHNRRFELPSVLVPFGLLIGYCILSWFIASFIIQPAYYKPLDTFISLKVERIDHLIAFLLFFYGVASTKDALSLIRIFLWMMVLGNLLTVVDGFNIPDLGIIQQREDGRLGGPLGESNQYGAFLALTLPAIVALVWDAHTKKPLAYFACVVSILALMASGSRGSYVGLFLGSAFAAFYLRSFITLRQIALAMTVSILAIVAVIAIFLTTDPFGDLLDRFIEKSSGDAFSISSGRSEIWATTIERMLEHPLSFVTGFGFDAYDHMRGFRANTHNSYLNILFNLGFPAVIIYLLLIYNIVAACRRALAKVEETVRVHLMAFVFGFAALSVSVLFVELYRPWIYIWAYVGLIMRLAVSSIRAGEIGADCKEPVSPLTVDKRQRNDLLTCDS